MSIKSDRWIRRMAEQHAMIEPYEPGQVKFADKDGAERIVSYGTSSYGYDVRCSREFKVFTNINSTIVDPKHFDPKSFVDIEADECIIPPNSFALARTVEYFRIPRDTLVVCLGKSTYARCGIIVNVTPLEPEWEGHVTLEFSNTTPLPARIYANEGVAQMLFFQAAADDVCETSYKDRGGKYQGQRGLQPVHLADQFFSRMTLGAGGAPDRARPGDVVLEARDHVDVQLGDQVPQRGNVEFVRSELGLEGPTGQADFPAEDGLLGDVEVDPLRRILYPRHQDQPGMVGVVHQPQFAEFQCGDRVGVLGQLRMQVPVGRGWVTSAHAASGVRVVSAGRRPGNRWCAARRVQRWRVRSRHAGRN